MQTFQYGRSDITDRPEPLPQDFVKSSMRVGPQNALGHEVVVNASNFSEVGLLFHSIHDVQLIACV